MVRRKKEEVSASFHFLLRATTGARGNQIIVPISITEFEALFKKMQSQREFDKTNEADIDRLRLRNEAPLSNLKMENPRIITGTFLASYWGHAYDNTHKGRISADSVNLRPFHFVLYLAEGGRLYVGCQYLGLYGGYEPLKKTLTGMMPVSKEIQSRSIRLGASYYRNAQPKEIRVDIANRSRSLTSRSSTGGKMMIALSRADKDDPMVERVRSHILPLFGKKQGDIKKAVAAFMNQSEVVAIADEDVLNCTVLAEMNGKQATIHMFENGLHATKFPINVPVDEEGHPANKETCKAILDVLNSHVIQVMEDV
jgi:hypothetical protein